jgi:chromosome segregation ATPase
MWERCMSKKFCHSAPKAFAPDDDLDKYIKNLLFRSQLGLVKRIKDVEDNIKSSRDDTRTLNDEVGTLKGELENWRDNGVISLEDKVEPLRAEVKRLQTLEAEIGTLKGKIKLV